MVGIGKIREIGKTQVLDDDETRYRLVYRSHLPSVTDHLRVIFQIPYKNGDIAALKAEDFPIVDREIIEAYKAHNSGRDPNGVQDAVTRVARLKDENWQGAIKRAEYARTWWHKIPNEMVTHWNEEEVFDSSHIYCVLGPGAAMHGLPYRLMDMGGKDICVVDQVNYDSVLALLAGFRAQVNSFVLGSVPTVQVMKDRITGIINGGWGITLHNMTPSEHIKQFGEKGFDKFIDIGYSKYPWFDKEGKDAST